MGKGGEQDPSVAGIVASSSGSASTLLQRDDRFTPFLGGDFNVAGFVSSVLAGSRTTALAQSEALREGVKALESELATEVCGRSGELLTNVRRMAHAESALQDVVLSVDSLQSAVRRIRAEICGPYDSVKTRTRQLRNLHATIDTLRQLIHRIKLIQKLRVQLGAPPATLDLAKAAKLITDIRSVDAEGDLTGITVVTADEAFLQQGVAAVRQQAEEALLEGMESMSQAKVGSALQVFFNLEELQQATSARMAKYLHDLERAAKAAVDSRHLGAPASRTAGAPAAAGGSGAGSWQDKLWQSLREVCEALQVACMGVWHLQRVVAKKKDPLTHVCFLDALVKPDEPLLTQRFWSDAMRVLTDVFASVSKPGKGGVVRDVLTSGYPKVAQMLETLFDRLASETTMKGVLPAVLPDQLPQLLACVSPFESAYRSACLGRMSDAVATAFPGGSRSLPSPADVQKCIGAMHEELRVAGGSSQLASVIASEVSMALTLLARKAEYMAATGPEVRAVAERAAANPAQLRNIALCSQLQEVHRSLSGLLPRLPQPATFALAPSLGMVQSVAIEAVAPIFKAVMEALEERVLKMHGSYADLGGFEAGPSGADDGGSGGGTSSSGGAAPQAVVVNTSAYILECSALVASFRSEFLSKFVPVPSPNVPSCAGALVERMASRLLLFFVRHASLVRPLGPQGKLQLAKDLAELQLGVGQNLFPLEQLAGPYRVLKAFRSLLFQDTSGVLGSPLIRDLPASLTLNHLFSRLPPSVRTPHERSGLSAAQYSLWLDEHTAGEVVESIAGALNKAEAEGKLDAVGKEVVAVMRALCAANQVPSSQ